MGDSKYALVLFCLLVFSSWAHAQSDEEGYISAEIFNKGLDFAKDLLIEKAETSLVPLELPNIEKNVKIPLIGKVHIEATEIILYKVHVTSSTAKTGDTGIVIEVSGATANLTANWKYSYTTWLVPVAITDKGEALIQVEGMEIGLTLSLKNEQGSLKLSVLECGCYVKELSIDVTGGASWLYQGFIDAFQGTITSRVESAISKKVKEGLESLNSVLKSLPKEVPIKDVAALNTTFIGDPELTGSSLSLAINGLLHAKDEIVVSNPYHENLLEPISFSSPARMAGISIHEKVFESASTVYFEANKMHWTVDKVPDQSLLNTAGWKFVVPQLYKQYPDDDMNLNISVYSPPIIKIEKQQIDATVPLDVIINVLDAGETIPVACISVVVRGAATPDISSNALGGTVKLNEFTMSQKWSKIGNLHMNLVQPVVSTLLRTVVLPYVNLLLNEGFPLPLFHGYGLQNTQIQYSDSKIVLFTDVAPIRRPQKLSPPVLQ